MILLDIQLRIGLFVVGKISHSSTEIAITVMEEVNTFGPFEHLENEFKGIFSVLNRIMTLMI